MSRKPFTELMELRPADGEDCFMGPIAPESSGAMFGGQFLAQGLVATQATVEQRNAHSLHAYFLRPGSVESETEYRVERVRDGRSFNSRCVSAWQSDKELFRMMVSYQQEEAGKEYSRPIMPDVPPPEAVSLTYGDYQRQRGGKHDDGMREPLRDWEVLYIDPPTETEGSEVKVGHRMWMRMTRKLGNQGIHRAALVYLSDATLIDAVVLPHGLWWESTQVMGTSLDHAMWFYGRVEADQWLLFDQCVEQTGGARGLATGRFFNQAGQLIATCCQEGLMRVL